METKDSTSTLIAFYKGLRERLALNYGSMCPKAKDAELPSEKSPRCDCPNTRICGVLPPRGYCRYPDQ